jgi:hypothetical protein
LAAVNWQLRRRQRSLRCDGSRCPPRIHLSPPPGWYVPRTENVGRCEWGKDGGCDFLAGDCTNGEADPSGAFFCATVGAPAVASSTAASTRSRFLPAASQPSFIPPSSACRRRPVLRKLPRAGDVRDRRVPRRRLPHALCGQLALL